METIRKLKKIVALVMVTCFMSGFAIPACSAATLPNLPNTSTSPAEHPASYINFDGEVKISDKNVPVTLSLRNSDVKQVLRMFADKAGRNIIFHASVEDPENYQGQSSGGGQQGAKVISTVTMDLVNVPLNNAFKMVLQVANLTYVIKDNTIIIMSLDAAKTSAVAKQNLSIIPVKYLDASKVALFLNKNIYASGQPGFSNSDIAVTNPERNEILLFGNNNDYLVAKKIIEQFDVKPNEATFVVNHTTPKEMASMVCRVLFKDLAKTADDDAVVLEDTDETTEEEDEEDDEEDSAESVEAGKGTIACQFRAIAEEKGGGGQDKNALVSLDSGGLTIVYFADRGTIYARGGTQEQMDQIKEFIAQNDKKQLQAYLEMSIVELNESGSREFSNTWNIYSSFFTGGFGTNLATSAPIYFQGQEIPQMFQNQQTPVLAKYTGAPVVTYAMNYLIQNGKGRVLANPRLLITSGKKTTINLTSSYVKKVTSQVMDTVSSLSGAVQKTYDIGEDLGIEIELQSFISPDGYVTLNVIPSYSTIKEQVTEPRTLVTNQQLGTTQVVNDLVATLIDTRELNLKNIRIKDGETMVIGGLLQEQETKRINKFPILGDIPLIGMFFRSTTSQKQKNELVIMLTPRIIQDADDIKNKVTL